MPALICGSVAYDTIMVFHDRFRNHILPDKIHVLSVSFLVPAAPARVRRLRGQHRLQPETPRRRPAAHGDGGKGLRPVLAVDGRARRIDHQHVTRIDTEYTAQAFITTDLDDNQIAAFHPGAMSSAHLNDVRDASGVPPLESSLRTDARR